MTAAQQPNHLQPNSTVGLSVAGDEFSMLPGVNVLLEGPTGTGKTFSLGSIADAGVELCCLFAESGREALMGYWTDRGLPIPPNVYWHDLPRGEGSFANLAEMAAMVNTYSMEALFKMQDPKRHAHNQFVTLLRALANFKDDRTGRELGPVDKWGPNRCLAIDSLTGLNPLAMSLVVGNKPLKDQRDWGVAQDQLIKLIRQLCDGTKCHFVMIAHVEREVDQVLGGVKLTVATLGRALAPEIPAKFSDVILTVRNGKEFSWSTANPQADLKTRNLPIADGIPASFGQIFDKWKSRGGKFTDKVKT